MVNFFFGFLMCVIKGLNVPYLELQTTMAESSPT